jgi:hypothetical protein
MAKNNEFDPELCREIFAGNRTLIREIMHKLIHDSKAARSKPIDSIFPVDNTKIP